MMLHCGGFGEAGLSIVGSSRSPGPCSGILVAVEAGPSTARPSGAMLCL